MTYWHMQLHPDEQHWSKEKEVLEKLSIIGLGGEKDSLKVIQFERDMRIGDIVLIKRGAESIALVEVTGDCEYDEDKVDWDFDWFYYRRAVKVLAFADKMPYFPQPRMTLQKASDTSSKSYQYINDWYKNAIRENNTSSSNGIKLREVYISKSKALRDFKISFLDEKGKVKSIVVIAGTNGSGKTTIFEYLSSFVTSSSFEGEDFISFSKGEEIFEVYKNNSIGKTKGISDFKKSIYYLPVFQGELDKLSKSIVTYIDKVIYEQGESSLIAYSSLQNKINNIFVGFDFYASFGSLNKEKNILFKNKDDEGFSINDLSTGEKVLLSKLLYLYLSEINNSIVLVDEPEMSLHPKWQSMIFSVYSKFAEETNNQVILATHSPQIIASVPYQHLIILRKENGKIVSHYPDRPPIGADVNSILDDFMGVKSEFPDKVVELHKSYREKVELGLEKTEEAEKIRTDLLQYESNDSRFMQEMRILMRLRGKK